MVKSKRRAKKLAKLGRAKPSKPLKPRVLIVCQGGKTEPNYLRDFCRTEKLFSPYVKIDDKGGGLSPSRLVEYAFNLFESDGEFSLIFVVFDKDTFSDYSRALNLIKNASLGEGTRILPINSVPCIEYWFILHFTYTDRPFIAEGNNSPGDATVRFLKTFLPTYNKGMEGISNLLLDKTDVAINNSKRALEAANQERRENPKTLMHVLILELRKVRDKII